MDNIKQNLTAAKERMLDAAEILFTETGGKGFSLRKLADSMGLTAPAVYIHFKNKSDLLVHMLDRRMLKKVQIWNELNPPPGNLDTRSRILRASRLYLQIGLEDFPAYLELYVNNPSASYMIRVLDEGDFSEAHNARYFKEQLDIWTEELGGRLPHGRDSSRPFFRFWAYLHGSVLLWGPLVTEGLEVGEALSQILPGVEYWMDGYQQSLE